MKQYRCKGCDRSFTRKDALKRHATQKNCGNDDWATTSPTPIASSKARRKTVSGTMSVAAPAASTSLAPSTRATRGSVNGPASSVVDGGEYYTHQQSGHQSGSTYVSPTLSHLPSVQPPAQADQQPSPSTRYHHHRLRSAPTYLDYANANGSHPSS